MKTKTIKQFFTIAALVTTTLAIGTSTVFANGGKFPTALDNNNGTVTDPGTGLVWLKNINCFGKQDWATASSSATSLQSGACGLSDKSTAGQWRLPTETEIKGMLRKRLNAPNYGTYYWSSKNNVTYYIHAENGEVFPQTYKTAVTWPVRVGQ